MNQEPLFLSPDAVTLLDWARSQPDFRDAFSREARAEQIERIIIGPREHYQPDANYPYRLYESWHYSGQWCYRQVSENLGWDRDRHSAASGELMQNGYAREHGYFVYEITTRGRALRLARQEVVPTC